MINILAQALIGIAQFFMGLVMFLAFRMNIVAEHKVRIHLKGGGVIEGWFLEFNQANGQYNWSTREVFPRCKMFLSGEVSGWSVIRRRYVLVMK